VSVRTFGAALVALLALAAIASAQVASGPIAWRGLVVRELFWGCGQMWSSHVAHSDVTLDVDARGRATLHVDARVVDGSGGVSNGVAQHDEHTRTLVIDWRGRARRVHGALVVELSALSETLPTPGASLDVTNRSTEHARLTCTRDAHDVMAASRPIAREGEPAIAQRPLVTCTFDAVPRGGALPRPVIDVLSTPFFLDDGAGVTTDAIYRGGVGARPDELVAREPGRVDP
jgi:hypothetical protein